MMQEIQTKLLQINPYHEHQWRKKFTATQWYRDVRQNLPADITEIWTRSALPSNMPASREFHFTRYFAMSTFYFIEKVLQTSPDTIVDLGCGGNLFRRLVRNLVGIDPYHPSADVNDFVDDGFIQGHRAQFDAAIAINSLHFRGLDQFRKVLDDFYSMLKPGGTGFITFGLGVMVDHTSDDAWIEIFDQDPINTTADTVIYWVDQQLRDLAWDLHVVDQYYFNHLEIGNIELSNPVDGNIRIVVRRSM
jgi:hypothetical protein